MPHSLGRGRIFHEAGSGLVPRAASFSIHGPQYYQGPGPKGRHYWQNGARCQLEGADFGAFLGPAPRRQGLTAAG